VVWGKKVEVVVKALDSEWQDVHGDKTQNICEKVCVWIGCGLEEQELLEICCHSEVCWKEFVAISRCMIWRRQRVNCEAHGLFFWWLFVCEACGQEIKKMQNRGQNMCACQVPMCFFMFCLCVHS
jgi:hypothetical protein